MGYDVELGNFNIISCIKTKKTEDRFKKLLLVFRIYIAMYMCHFVCNGQLYKIFLCFFVNVLWSPGHCNFIDKIFRSKSWNSKLIDFYSQEYPIKSFKERLTRTQSYFYKASYCRVKLLYKLKTLILSSTFDNLFDILETINLSEARTF